MGVAIVFEVRETQCSGFPFSLSLFFFLKEFSPQEYMLVIINYILIIKYTHIHTPTNTPEGTKQDGSGRHSL